MEKPIVLEINGELKIELDTGNDSPSKIHRLRFSHEGHAEIMADGEDVFSCEILIAEAELKTFYCLIRDALAHRDRHISAFLKDKEK